MWVRFHAAVLVLAVLAGLAFAGRVVRADGVHPLNPVAFANESGLASTFSSARSVDFDNPFFRTLGTNARSCATCHEPAAGWSVTPANVQKKFEATGGLDPIFSPHDAATSPTSDVSTVEARRRAYALLLGRGLVRVGLPLPADAEFSLLGVDDPYGNSERGELSLFRRPLPATNLAFLTTLMWDGREVIGDGGVKAALALQANRATIDHAQAAEPLANAQRTDIVAFETGLFTAQAIDRLAGDLRAAGGRGGPATLAAQRFYPGINRPLGTDPATGKPFDHRVFTLFDAWAQSDEASSAPQRAVVHGQRIFNERVFAQGRLTCSTCHNAPNAGSNSLGILVNNGIADESRRTPDLPLYTLRCRRGPHLGRTIKTTDPGRALVTGRCVDIGSFKIPALRGLATRPPYFHDGSAARLEDVVEFYEEKFRIGLSADEKADLVAFLRAL